MSTHTPVIVRHSPLPGAPARRNAEGKRRSRGLTLIEAAMVLAISTLVVAGIMVFFQGANLETKRNEAVGQLAAIQQAVRTTFAGQPSYSGLTAATLISSKALPSKMSVGGTALRHAFNGAITITEADAGGGTASGFQVVFSGVPVEACTKMATMDMGTGVESLTIGSVTEHGKPFTPAQAITACGTGTSQTMTWIFF